MLLITFYCSRRACYQVNVLQNGGIEILCSCVLIIKHASWRPKGNKWLVKVTTIEVLT